ncbi:MAG TPA: VOC family protein [Romboutsia timonensis]|uniref:VOC family protein n=1 Tax=Romboutsia timonensis TaxID=1776391 RepID=A0A921MYD7_9FIRM|nr:VOC family protein [uncultured Romboutsia sp.]HJG95626.1 VOC family protein [Romboutsia timonensis]
MRFKFCHNNFNVLNLEKSLEFYKNALGLVETKRTVAEDGSFILVFLGDGESTHKLELTWLRDWERPYNLGDNEFHLAFRVEEFDDAYNLHKEMGCICYENKEMGIYFIADPDNYWIEILPANMK